MNINETLRQLEIQAGGPGSGRHKEVLYTGLNPKHIKMLKSIPEEDLKGLHKISIVDNIKTRGITKSNVENVGGYQGYVDYPGEGFIRLTKNADDFDLAHEIGHHVWNKLDNDDKDNFSSNKNKLKVGAYSKPSKEEQFAESYALLVSGKFNSLKDIKSKLVVGHAAKLLGYNIKGTNLDVKG